MLAATYCDCICQIGIATPSMLEVLANALSFSSPVRYLETGFCKEAVFQYLHA